MRSTREKALDLLRLHADGNLLVLPNVWDPIGARILAAKGFPAVATASAAISASLGYADGEKIRRSTMIEFVARIARSVDLPVTADMEAGYGDSPAELRETASQVIDSGVVGVNLQDSLDEGHALRTIDEQCRRINAFRQAAAEKGVHLVINARVDSFLSPSYPEKTRAIDEAVARAKPYADAGADCIYPIGPSDEATVRTLRERISSPLNILVSPTAPALSVLKQIGINRVSFGPFVFRACLARFAQIADALKSDAGYSSLADMMPREEATQYLRGDPE
jgi:2-methylisocitrate lyase-like PEP mutase family enzyme